MSELITIICDVCGAKLADGLTFGNAKNELEKNSGIWFNGGAIGLPHVCKKCERTKTIAEIKKVLLRRTRSPHG